MKVFISTELSENDPLIDASIALGFDLIHRSLLSFSAVNSAPTQPYDIVFFSSPRAYAFGKHLVLPTTKIACVSIGTANQIQLPVDWFGTSPSNPKQTALDFKEWVGERRVLFPVSSRSFGNISSVFSPEQVECVTVYETILNPSTIEPCEIYMFTSPSNAEAFLLKNTIQHGAAILAKGTSTHEYLQQIGIVSTCFPDDSMGWEQALVSFINP
ncbi:MAG: uroporphyrinogen-III synthase [Flavobacteriales bacterium]